MNSNDLVLHMISLFDRLGIPYMLVGSYSSNYYGRPRLTKDADFGLVSFRGGLGHTGECSRRGCNASRNRNNWKLKIRAVTDIIAAWRWRGGCCEATGNPPTQQRKEKYELNVFGSNKR